MSGQPPSRRKNRDRYLALFIDKAHCPRSLLSGEGRQQTLAVLMAARQWALQWARLARQEAELGAEADSIREAAQAPPSARSRESGGPAGSLQNIRTQLNRQLAALEALQAAEGAGQVAPAALDRRRQQHTAALAQLATMCAAQLQELQQLEAQLGEEYEAASASVQEALAAPRGAGRASSSSDGASPRPAPAPAAPVRGALTASGSSSLPAEVTAHDTFMQRHGPTGELCNWHALWFIPCSAACLAPGCNLQVWCSVHS